MALIKCPECSNEVSDKATSCPKCGYPLLQLPSPQLEVEESKSKEQQYHFSVDMSTVGSKALDDFVSQYPNSLILVSDDGRTRTYKVRSNDTLYLFTTLLKKKLPEIRIGGDAVQYVERLVRDSAILVARRARTDVVGKFIGWLVGLTICTGLVIIMLVKCSPDTDLDYKAGRDFAFRLRYAEKYSFGTNQSLSEGDRDDVARSYVPKTLSAERQEKWKDGFKSGLGL
jgi:hypothetical protein